MPCLTKKQISWQKNLRGRKEAVSSIWPLLVDQAHLSLFFVSSEKRNLQLSQMDRRAQTVMSLKIKFPWLAWSQRTVIMMQTLTRQVWMMFPTQKFSECLQMVFKTSPYAQQQLPGLSNTRKLVFHPKGLHIPSETRKQKPEKRKQSFESKAMQTFKACFRTRQKQKHPSSSQTPSSSPSLSPPQAPSQTSAMPSLQN